MITICFLLVILAAGVESLICPIGQQPCGSIGCYDPTIQGCSNSGGTIQCINSCNGSCYSNSQYCYNNTQVCNNGELVCNVKNNGLFSPLSWGLTCYNTSQLVCSNDTLCDPIAVCGTQCLTDFNSTCVNNRTICSGFEFWYSNVNVCGPQKQCYDTTTSVCLNRTTVCQGLKARFCGSNCFNPDTQICTNGIVRCIHSCNGICYSNSQYCYNNTNICNNGESFCNVKNNTDFPYFPLGPTCYDSSQLVCSNNTLCYPQYACGTQCLTDSNSTCVNNRTICYGFNFWNYYYSNTVNVCGPQKQCYDNTTSVCLSGTTVCQGLNARLCGSNCFNPNTQICTNRTVRCIHSCNGTCYSNSQYCYNNTQVCNNGELVCNVKNNGFFSPLSWGLTCYNSSQLVCSNDTLCDPIAVCGMQCLTDSNSTCVNNQTICSGFEFWYSNVNVCGPQQQCYDDTTSVCLGNNGTVCPIGNQLCSGICYNPQSQYCIGGNNTIYCLSNPSSSNCSCISNNNLTTTMSSNSCCAVQNCTTNSDCCQTSSIECQCHRQNQTDVYGSCVNPYVTSMCNGICPVEGKCRNNSDCCKCQCAQISFTNVYGNLITKKQCVPR